MHRNLIRNEQWPEETKPFLETPDAIGLAAYHLSFKCSMNEAKPVDTNSQSSSASVIPMRTKKAKRKKVD